jgi:monoamine oxidase
MERYLNDRGSVINDNTMVTAIVDPHLNDPGLHRGGLTVETVSSGKSRSQTYPAVFCTAPLSTLGIMDLSKSGIHSNYAQWSGIRELQYGPAIKIGIRFKTNWWDEKFNIVGGQRYGHGHVPVFRNV